MGDGERDFGGREREGRHDRGKNADKKAKKKHNYKNYTDYTDIHYKQQRITRMAFDAFRGRCIYIYMISCAIS